MTVTVAIFVILPFTQRHFPPEPLTQGQTMDQYRLIITNAVPILLMCPSIQIFKMHSNIFLGDASWISDKGMILLDDNVLYHCRNKTITINGVTCCPPMYCRWFEAHK